MDNNELFLVNIFIEGPKFKDHKASLSSALKILESYDKGLQFCLEKSSKKYSTLEKASFYPSIHLNSVRQGSLDVSTFIDLTVATLPLFPCNSGMLDVILYGTNLYKKASELISYATKFFKEEGHPVNINIDRSPGASPVLIISGGNVTVTPDVFAAAKQIKDPLETMAQQIIDNNADSISISQEHEDDNIVKINQTNKFDFKVPSIERTDTQPITIKCGLYSLNKRTRKGKLELFEEVDDKFKYFTIAEDGPIDLYIEGLNASYSEVEVERKMKTNALGETKIDHLYIYSITNHFKED